ncbi:uncharacterized protein LOC134214542 [Armigeres subalbatus]|uniref:uncharacterized protein LOC134214542 n=1 Tax=Armigeres subalbatus TaxID=124917 RepID=UPI002ED42B0C
MNKATDISLKSFPSNTGLKPKATLPQTRETNCHFLTTEPTPPKNTQPNSSSNLFSSSSYNVQSGCAAATTSKKQARSPVRSSKNFMGCHPPKCPTNPIVAVNSTSTPKLSSGGARSSSNHVGAADELCTISQLPSPTERITASRSEIVFDIGFNIGDESNTSPGEGEPSNKMGNNTADDILPLSSEKTMATVSAALSSVDRQVLSIASSFLGHAIRSNYMDKSIKAKKKVIRMLLVIIMEFVVSWAPLHILNTAQMTTQRMRKPSQSLFKFPNYPFRRPICRSFHSSQ